MNVNQEKLYLHFTGLNHQDATLFTVHSETVKMHGFSDTILNMVCKGHLTYYNEEHKK